MIGRIGRAIKEKICEDVRVLAMMCIGKWRAVWFSRNISVLQASAETRSVLSRVECRVLYVRTWLPYVLLALSVAGYR